MEMPEVVLHDFIEAAGLFVQAGLNTLPEKARLQAAEIIETGQARVQVRVTLAPLEVHLLLVNAEGQVEIGKVVGNDG